LAFSQTFALQWTERRTGLNGRKNIAEIIPNPGSSSLSPEVGEKTRRG